MTMTALPAPACDRCADSGEVCTARFVAWNPKRKDSPGWFESPTGCHVWTGAVAGRGYGYVYTRHGNRYIHRLRYEREVGPIPEGMQLDHYVCDNKLCCNPLHVRPVTARENILRGNSVAAICAARSHCPEGHPLAGNNLCRADLKLGHRKCRICANVKAVRYYATRRCANG